jgi:S1-C subfamily serine protease
MLWMGATVRNLVGQGEMSEKGAPTETGVIVVTVPPGSAAARAGLQPGDLLLEATGEAAGSTGQLRSITNSCKSGQRVNLSGLRNQRKVEFTLTCAE